MKSILFVGAICAGVCMGTITHAGLGPSPFKESIKIQLAEISAQLAQLDDIQGNSEFLAALNAVDVQKIGRKLLATQTIVIMERISSIILELPTTADQTKALATLSRLLKVGFDPQPEPPGHTLKSLVILDRISLKFAPQPEPPLPGAVGDVPEAELSNYMDALDRISALAFEPHDWAPEKTAEMLAIVDAVSLVGFAPQPEPPGDFVVEVFNILNALQNALGLSQGGPTLN